MLLFNMTQRIMEKRDRRYIPEDDIKILDNHASLPEDVSQYVFDVHSKRRMEVETRLLTKLGYNYAKNRDKLAFYIPTGFGIIWSQTFGLYFAQRVCPEDRWELRRGEKYTTVIVQKNIKFLILYFGLMMDDLKITLQAQNINLKIKALMGTTLSNLVNNRYHYFTTTALIDYIAIITNLIHHFNFAVFDCWHYFAIACSGAYSFKL